MSGNCDMAFESCLITDDWRINVTVQLYEGKGDEG